MKSLVGNSKYLKFNSKINRKPMENLEISSVEVNKALILWFSKTLVFA